MAAKFLTFFFSDFSGVSLLSEDFFQKLMALKNRLRVGFSSSGITTVMESALLLLPKSLEKRFDFEVRFFCFSSSDMIKGSVFFRKILVRVDLFVDGTCLAWIIGLISEVGAELLFRTFLLETDECVFVTQQQLALRRKNEAKIIATKKMMSPFCSWESILILTNS